ncbi:response regulator [Clostridium ganghwense]|uniref:Stage 0 sporulation protein A homolog n=1 Tax=Clostridium ganghwense TaxID=312089 RepID=A0ABT4CJN2_9CLOT|nr:response regulator [Clostridium ganghwense]
MGNVVVVENKSYVRQNIITVLNSLDINLIEASNSVELFNELYKLKNNVDLILMETNLGTENAFEIMDKLRKKDINIPIIFLSADKKRSTIIRGIMAGAVDYIIIPCSDDILTNKIKKHLNLHKEENIEEKSLNINFKDYLTGELRKAAKGKYSVSILMLLLDSDNKDIVFDNSNIIYKELKKLFWETDLFVKFGSKSFIGVFPFASKKNVSVIKDKIDNLFIESKIVKENSFKIENISVTYPVDGSDMDTLLEKLLNNR